MAPQIDIDCEYEKLFGKKEPINLFDSDEEYEILRQVILSQTASNNDTDKLPFDGVILYPYTDYLWNKSIQDAKEKGFHLFFIKQTTPYCKAAGYYDSAKKMFVLLKASKIVASNNYDKEHVALLFGRRKLLRNKFIREESTCTLTEDVKSSVPLLSASYVLGTVADISKWRDEDGRSLSGFYPELARLQRQELLKIKEKEREEANRKEAILNIVNGVKLYVKAKEERHLFYIIEEDVCKAEGYYDPSSKYFYISKGSLVAKESDILYASSQSGLSRVHFLDKACTLRNNYYLVKKDAKCRSAVAAACYVLGQFAGFEIWKDAKGKSLKEIYPSVFFNNDPNKLGDGNNQTKADEQQLFYIIKNNGTKRECHAKGKYDIINNKFIILKDSILSLEVSFTYRFSVSDAMRQNFIKLNCIKKANGYVVKRDALCESPSAAASFVLGRSANGWSEWKDKDNRTLKEVYKK